MRITLTGSSAEQKTKFTLASSFQLAPLPQVKFCQKKDGDVFEKSVDFQENNSNNEKMSDEFEYKSDKFWDDKIQKRSALEKERQRVDLLEFCSAKKEFLSALPESPDFEAKKEKYLQLRETVFNRQKPIIDGLATRAYKRNLLLKNPMLAKDELQGVAYFLWSEAESKFNPDVSQSFDSYIFNRIGWGLWRYSLENASSVYVSKAPLQAERYAIYKKFQEATNGEADFLRATPEQIAEIVGCTPLKAARVQKLTLTRMSKYSLDRENSKTETFIKNELQSSMPPPPVIFENNESMELLDKIFEGLPESYKTKYLREFLDGKKIQEIAQELEVSRSAVHQGVKKGMAVLREIMDKPDTSRGNVLASILILSEAFEKIPRKAKKIFAEEIENFLASRSGTEKYTIENFDKNEKIKNHNFFNKNEIIVKTAQRLKKLL